MGDLTTKFGSNAGKIWSVLNEKGSLNKDELLKTTKLDENDFHIGIGWLARENKIARDQNLYKLDQTNLESEIGMHAGQIYKIINIWQDVDFSSIKRLTNLRDEEIHAALGWLAREDKIQINEHNRFTLKNK